MDIKKEKTAIMYLKHFQPRDIHTGEEEAYWLCYSGGKDSDVILTLAKLADVKFEAVHNLTTADEPATVQYVRSNPDVRINYPNTSMWKLIVKKRMPPTRLVRYCCEELKERGGRFRTKVTGVRWAESNSRKANRGVINIQGKEKTVRRLAEEVGLDYFVSSKGGLVLNDDNEETRAFVDHCYRTTSVMVNPIVDWTDDDVWDFLYHYGIKSNPLYEARERNGTYCPFGDTRVGCVACPMQGKHDMVADLIRYPKYRDNYLRAFDRMLIARQEAGLPTNWKNAREVMMWWVDDDPRQLSLFGEPEYLRGACL